MLTILLLSAIKNLCAELDSCYGYVIEFQSSPITSSEFDERTDFYKTLGYKVIWIFNFIEEYRNDKITCYDEWHKKNDSGGKFHWSYASKTFINFKTATDGVILFFQFAEEDNDICYLEKVVWAINCNSEMEETDFKSFFTSYYPGNFFRLMEKMKTKSL